jgi:uroporphyrinogen decarboxylase
MTSRERVLFALGRQGKPDKTPMEISFGVFTPELMERYRKETASSLEPFEYFDFDTRPVFINQTTRKTDFQKYFPDKLPGNIVMDEWGSGGTPGSVKHFLEYKYHPLAACETPEEINAFDWPDIDADYRYEGLDKQIQDYKERGYATLGEMYQTLYEMTWLLRGMERTMMDFYDNPDIIHAICDNITKIRLRQARQFAALGVDILRLGDDVTCQMGWIMSVDCYREFFKERTRKIIQAAKEINPKILVFMHSDGKVDGLIPELIDIGVDILNPVQPECNDLRKIVDEFGSKISFWGGIGTQSVMPFGTPEEVRKKTRETWQILGKNGNLLLAPTHILEPEVPWENVMAFINEARACKYV